MNPLAEVRTAQLLTSVCVQVGPATERNTAVPAVGVDDVRAVISAWTQIPIERLTDDEQARLLGLEDSLQVC